MTNSEGRYHLAAIDLSGTQYTVEQTGRDENLRPEYEARDVTGETIFRSRYEMYQSKETFPFVDDDGTELFTVTARKALDIAGEYVLTDTHTGEDVVVLDNDLSLLRDTWRIRDAEDGTALAEITSRGALVTAGRKLLPFGGWVGHEFEITDGEGEAVGSIESEFGMLDEYEVTITDASSVPVEPIVVGAVVIDAIQNN